MLYNGGRMAPKTKITREMILTAAFDIVRGSGYETLNARTVADRLKCSTQPVLYQFKTMAEIREAVYAIADQFHTEYIMKGAAAADNPFLGLGLAYIRFGYEEKNLFRFLFQSNHFAGIGLLSLLGDPEMAPLLELARRELECGEEEIREKFLVFTAVVHGYASLLANNSLEYDEAQAVRMLEISFSGMKGNQR